MSTLPKISVVIPLFNKAPYIAATLQSVLAQDTTPLEILVIDDGSTDNGDLIVEGLGEACSSIRLIRQTNAGVSAARNRGIREAQGDFIAFLDADDYWFPDYLSEICTLIDAYPKANQFATAFVFTRSLTEHNRQITSSKHSLIEDYYGTVLDTDPFCTCSICIRRSAFYLNDIWFSVGERLGEDLDVWFRLSEISPIAFSQRQCVAYFKDDPCSLTYSAVVLEPLKCYRNLNGRLSSGLVPAGLRKSAARLVSSHWINIARNRAGKNQLEEAWQLMKSPVARANFSYWIRVTIWLAIRTIVRRAKTAPGAS